MADVLKMYFPPEEAARLAGVGMSRLRYWVREYAVLPERQTMTATMPAFFTFRDVVALRVLAALRNLGVPLQQLRKVGDRLAERVDLDTPWSKLRFWLAGKEVYFTDPTDGAIEHAFTGQMTDKELFDLQPVVAALEKEIVRSRSRKASDRGKVTRTRGVMGSQPCIAGTRIPTRAIWDFHQAGYTVPQIIEQYPDLSRADVSAALKFEKAHPKRKKNAA